MQSTIFGGYTEANWAGDESLYDENASSGPAFGHDDSFDMKITYTSNASSATLSSKLHRYQKPDDISCPSDGVYFTDPHDAEVSEIEVFKVENI